MKITPSHMTKGSYFVSRWNWWALAPAALAFVAIAVPYLLTHSSMAFGLALAQGFAVVCHQQPTRSFWLAGAPVAVCARCLGVYLGAAIGLLLQTSRPVAMRLLIAAAALNLLDVATELASLHANWLVVRFVLGIALGAAGALLISSSLDQFESRNITPHTPASLLQSWPLFFR